VHWRQSILSGVVAGFGSVLLCALLIEPCLAQSRRTPTPPPQTSDDKSQTPPAPRSQQAKPRNEPVAEKPQTVDPDEIVRISTDLTNVLFTAVNKDKQFVTSLKKDDLQILENGVAQEITMFERETDLPLSIGILVDVSGSEERTLPDEKAAAREFVHNVIHPAKDKVAILSFTGEATVEQDLTNRVLALEKAIDNIEIVLPLEDTSIISASGRPIHVPSDPRAGSTAIWDAILSTSNEMLGVTPEHTRRAIILLTDGEDTSSRVRMQDAVDTAIKQNVVIYSIGIGDRRNFGIDTKTLKKISEKTGGRAFFPDNELELNAAFTQIQDELRSQYLIAYSSTNRARDGSFRRIQIDVLNPDYKKEKLRLLYRDGYYARAGRK
jgi:Ca-activated chloride channel family protein